MRKELIAITAASLFSSCIACAAENTGVDRAVKGAKETITSPGEIVDGIQNETQKRGAVGVVTGSVKGGAAAAGQAVKGAADVGVGIIEAIVD